MADLTRSAQAGLDASTGMFAGQKSGNLYAGENLAAAAPCYIKAADGRVYQSNGTAANEAAKFDGFTPVSYLAGEPVTLFTAPARFRYGTGLAIGTDLFVSVNAGQLGDAASTGGVRAIARVITSTDIVCTKHSDAA